MDAIEWIDPFEGFVYRDETMMVDADEHARALTACGIDPSLFGDKADPSFFIAEAIQAGVRSGITSDGNVNMVQSLVQRRPVELGETLRIHGRITAVQEVARGWTVDTDVSFEGADGVHAISAKRRTLKPDPDKVGAAKGGAGERPPPVVEDPLALEVIGEHTLTPAMVTAYRSDGNRIHFDPVAAQEAGFQAPIIGGGMGVHYLMAAIWGRGEPAEFDLDIYFRRPVFWDDAVTVRVDGARDGNWRAICLTKGEAKGEKVVTEARINTIA